MEKAEWEEAYKAFDKAYRELESEETDYKNSRNKKIRDAAGRKMDSIIHRVKYLLNKYEDVYIMASGGEMASDMHRTFIMDEFIQHRHIVRDLGSLLFSMKEKIDGMDTDAEATDNPPVV